MTDYVFPAVFTPAPEIDGYSIHFPDIDGIHTDGDDAAHALEMASEALSLHLYSMIEDGDAIPTATRPERIEAPPGGFVSLVRTNLAMIQARTRSTFVRKNCTVPQWMALQAEKANINFSQVLQDALSDILQIRRP